MRLRASIFFLLLTSVSFADTPELRAATESFQLSQQKLRQAHDIKSIDRLLAHLDDAEQQLHKAKESASKFVGSTDVGQRLQLRLSAKLARDLAFLRGLKEDLGLAEHDNFEVYGNVRKAFLKEAKQGLQVKQMDIQILLTVEKFFHERFLNRL